MNIDADEDRFKYIFKCNAIPGYIIMLLFLFIMIYSAIKPFGLIGSTKLQLTYLDAETKQIEVDLFNPDRFPLFFQLRWHNQSTFNSTDICGYFNNNYELDMFRMYQYLNHTVTKEVHFNCIPEEN